MNAGRASSATQQHLPTSNTRTTIDEETKVTTRRMTGKGKGVACGGCWLLPNCMDDAFTSCFGAVWCCSSKAQCVAACVLAAGQMHKLATPRFILLSLARGRKFIIFMHIFFVPNSRR